VTRWLTLVRARRSGASARSASATVTARSHSKTNSCVAAAPGLGADSRAAQHEHADGERAVTSDRLPPRPPPGTPVALLYRVWLGHIEYDAAIRCGGVVVEGTPALAKQLPRWFMWSPMAHLVREREHAPARRSAASRN
jgi:hypothetical protein